MCEHFFFLQSFDSELSCATFSGRNLKIGKKNCSLKPLIGCPFGSLFQVDNGKDGPYLSLVVQSKEEEEEGGVVHFFKSLSGALGFKAIFFKKILILCSLIASLVGVNLNFLLFDC